MNKESNSSKIDRLFNHLSELDRKVARLDERTKIIIALLLVVMAALGKMLFGG